MKIYLDPEYIKHYRKRIIPTKNLHTKAKERIELFKHDSKHPLLKDHALAGSHFPHRSFWITGDIRIVYEIIGIDEALFLDIGSHNQVY